jgi:hypothetical protein
LAREPRLQVTELRDFDLQLALERMRALRENVENQLAAIDHTNLQLVLEIARLRGAECVVENRERCAFRGCQLAHLARLALADKSARVGRLQALPNNAGNFGAGALGQCFKFVERFFAADSRFGTKFDSNQDGAFVMLVSNVVRLSQLNTSIVEDLRLSVYQIPPPRGTPHYLNSIEPGGSICSISATKVSVGVTR